MKKPFILTLFFILLLSINPILFAQNTDAWAGKWEGAIELPGTALNVIVHLEKSDGNWNGTLDIPVQRVKGMNLVDLELTEETITFSLPEVPGGATFSGELQEKKIAGTFAQMGQSFPMSLMKEDATQQAALAEKIAQIRALTDSLILKAKVPGLGMGLIYKGDIQLAEGFGFRDVEEELPTTASTVFAIGSSSKAFTTMGLGLLADDGLLDWDEPITTYLPDFKLADPFATKEMTAVDLVTHRSGLPRHDLLWYLTDFSRDELYARLRYLEPTESFRSKWQYQNLMFMTAGILTEKISGNTWEDYIESRIFEPLGMETAHFSVANMQNSAEAARGYGEDEGELKELPYHEIGQVGPAGSINASVTDMLKWLELQMGDGTFNGQDFVNATTLERMHRPHMTMESNLLGLPGFSHPSYGLGWFIYDYDGLYVVEHGGNIDGFSALVFMIPDEELGLVILTNKNGAPLPYLLAYSITDLLLDRTQSDWYSMAYGEEDDTEKEEEEETEEEEKEARRVAGTTAQHVLADYVGVYEHPGYGEIEITLAKEQLTAKYYGLSAKLEHWHYETFWGKDETNGLELKPTFETDQDGRVVALREATEISLPETRFVKKPDNQLSDPEFLETLVGTYMLSGERTLEISRRGNRLFAFLKGQPEYELVPLQGLEFKLSPLEGFTMEFIKENDRVVAVVSHQPNGHFRAERN